VVNRNDAVKGQQFKISHACVTLRVILYLPILGFYLFMLRLNSQIVYIMVYVYCSGVGLILKLVGTIEYIG